MHHTNNDIAGEGTMHLRNIFLSDGRYMIFYTFDEPDAQADAGTEANSLKGPADPGKPDNQAEEERNV
jgi:hypothetical protein